MTGREVAWRVTAHELLSSSQEEKGEGEWARSYVISPLGGRMNRLLMAGTVTVSNGEPRGSNGVRGTLADATGSVPLAASSFQPNGQSDLASISAPTPAFVVGKAALFRGAGTLPVASVRVEAIRPLPDSEYRSVSTEIAAQTLERLELVLRMRAGGGPSDAELVRAGISPVWVRGARVSIERYPTFDPSPFIHSLRKILSSLQQGSTDSPRPTEARRPVTDPVVRTVHAREPAPTPTPPAGSRSLEGRLLEILDELADESPDGYADMDDLAERAARHGLDGEKMEELLNYLSESGTIEEPLVGKFRRSEGPPPSG